MYMLLQDNYLYNKIDKKQKLLPTVIFTPLQNKYDRKRQRTRLVFQNRVNYPNEVN